MTQLPNQATPTSTTSTILAANFLAKILALATFLFIIPILTIGTVILAIVLAFAYSLKCSFTSIHSLTNDMLDAGLKWMRSLSNVPNSKKDPSS